MDVLILYSRKVSDVESELDNILGILEPMANINPSLYCDLLEVLRYILYLSGNWVARDQFMADGLIAANKTDDPCRRLLFASDLGWVSTYRRKFDKALRYFEAARPALELCPEAYYRAKFYLDLARLHYLISANEKTILLKQKRFSYKLFKKQKTL